MTHISAPGKVAPMAKVDKKKEKPRKTYAVSFNRELMLKLKYLALAEDKFVNDLLEEATEDLLKKYQKRAQ